MDLEPLAKLAVNYGLGIILTLLITATLGWLIKYILKENKLREEQSVILQQNYQKIIKDDIALLSNRIESHDAKNAAAAIVIADHNREIKKDHEIQLKYALEVKEENERRRQAQEKIVIILDQINSSLTSMNARMNK